MSKFGSNRPTATTKKKADYSGLTGRQRAAIQRANQRARSQPKSVESIAGDLLNFLGERDLIRAAMNGDINPVLAGGLVAAGMIPVPGPKAATKAVTSVVGKGAKKKAAETGLTQTVGDAVGEAGQKAANDAVGRKTPKRATGNASVKVPKSKPPENPPNRDNYKHASSHSRAVKRWQQNVQAWNKANPDDKVVQPTPDRLTEGRGKASTDTERQVKKSDADKSDAEKATVAKGEREKAKRRRREQKEAERAETDPTDIEFGEVLDFVTRLRKQRVPGTGFTGRGKTKKTQTDELLANMRRRLRERDEGTDSLDGLGRPGRAPSGVRNPERFTTPTEKQRSRGEVQGARFESATGRKIPREKDAVRREGTREDPGFSSPAKGSPEARLQARAQAEAAAEKADDRTRNLMDGQRLSGEPGSNKRAPENPRGPDYNPNSTADTAFDNYSTPQSRPRTTAAGAEQNVRIGRADGTVTEGRVVTPQEDLGPRGRPVVARGANETKRSFEGMSDDDMVAEGYVKIQREYIDENGNVSYRSEWAKPDMDVGIGGPGTPPSLNYSRPNYSGFGGGSPAVTRTVDERIPSPRAPEASANSGKTNKGKKGKKNKEETPAESSAAPKPVDNSPEARRARNYDRYRELERKGILNPGDADRIMSGGKGAKEVFEGTPTAKQRSQGVKPGEAKKAKQKEEKKKRAAAAAGGVPESADRLARRLRGSSALAGTGAIAYAGFNMRGENDRDVIIPTNQPLRGGEEPGQTNTSMKRKQGFVKDKYGRRITREEFQRREDFRQLRESLRGKVPASALKEMRKKEMRRREKFRNVFGKNTAYNIKTRNIGSGGTQTRILDTDAKKRTSGAFRG